MGCLGSNTKELKGDNYIRAEFEIKEDALEEEQCIFNPVNNVVHEGEQGEEGKGRADRYFGAGRGCQRGEVLVPLEYVPRNPHTDQRGARHERDDPAGMRGRQYPFLRGKHQDRRSYAAWPYQ